MQALESPSPDSGPTGARRRVFFGLMLAVPVVAIVVVYGAALIAQASYFYYFYRVLQHEWVGEAWVEDPQLGYTHARSFEGVQTLSPEISASILLDADGFRVTSTEPAPDPRPRPLLLTIGDSFAFGYGVEAEEAFPHRVAEALGGSSINASVMGFSLAQILIEARRLAPIWKPDYLLIPYSGWIIDRSVSGLSTTRMAAIPTPYFIESDDGALEIVPPLTRPIVFDLALHRAEGTPVGVGDSLSFVFGAAVPALLHRDLVTWRLRIERALGSQPSPIDDDLVLERAYRELSRIAVESGARLVIVSLTNSAPDPDEIERLRALPNAIVVETFGRLWERLPEPSELAYIRAYQFWSADGKRLVDRHPNARAHALIAEDVLDALDADRRTNRR